MGQTVNLLLFSFGGSNPSAPTRAFARKTSSGGNSALLSLGMQTGAAFADRRGATAATQMREAHFFVASELRRRESSSVDRALAFQAGGRGFESRLSLTKKHVANVAQW